MRLFHNFLKENTTNIDNALSRSLRNEIKKRNGKVYQIGGAVRDELIGKVSKDLDLLVTGLGTDELENLLSKHGKVDAVGKSFGILKFLPFGQKGEPLDISVPRVDVQSTGGGHKDFEVKLGKDISLEQDQLRRDFWMNAIAKDVETGEVFDIDGKGQFDIDNKQISVINPKAFEDDPLRMLRAIQFASRFEFSIESKTMKEIKANAKRISTVSAERFNEEFKKMFEKSNKPSLGLDLLYETGIMSHIFSRVKKKQEMNIVVDRLNKESYATFLAIMLMSYGKSAPAIASQKLRISNEVKSNVKAVIDYMIEKPKGNLEIINFISNKSETDIKNVDSFIEATKGVTLSYVLNSMKRSGLPTSLKELPIKGTDVMRLGLRGSDIGDALKYALEFSINTNVTKKDGLLKAIDKKYSKR